MNFLSRLSNALNVRIFNSYLPDDYDFYAVNTNSGVQIVEKRDRRRAGAYYSNAFRACLLAKARPLASLPIHIYVREGGVREEPTDAFLTAFEGLLRHKWNPFMTGAQGIRWMLMTKDTRGEAFARVQFGRDGLPKAIWPLSGIPDIEVTARNKVIFRYAGDKFTEPGRYFENEIIWVKSPVLDDDCLHGVSLAELAARELNLSIDLEEFYANVLGGDSSFAGWLETDQKLSAQDFKALQQQVSDGGGLVSAGRIRIFDKGLTYKSNGQSMADMSLVQQETWILQQTCRTLSVPPQEVFELSHATYSNIEQGALNFANKTLVPECVEFENAFGSILWLNGFTTAYAQLDMNGLLRGSYKDRMEGYRIGLYAGIFNRNEVRAKEDMAPYNGGDMFMQATAYGLLDPETGDITYQGNRASMRGTGSSGENPSNSHAKGTALAVIHRDMECRIRDRMADCKDEGKAREFAEKVLAPIADAYEVDGIEYDMNEDIERILHG